jgi:general secretion pathway protein A
MLTGEVGTGKTTLLRTLLEQLPEHVDIALIFNPKLTPDELVATICDELKISRGRGKASLKALVDRLNTHLLKTYAEGRRTVLIVDEAQALGADVLEQLRLLTNLETTREKLLEIILVGQPELRDTLARRDLRQLSQRITARYHLTPLNRHEVRLYVRHRLAVAGARRELFSDAALRELARATGGVPRLINEIGDRSLLGAYAEERPLATRKLVSRATRQVMGEPARRPGAWPWVLAPVGVLALVVILGAWWSGGFASVWPRVLERLGVTGDPVTPPAPVVVRIESPDVAGAADTPASPEAVAIPAGTRDPAAVASEGTIPRGSEVAGEAETAGVSQAGELQAWLEQHREGLTRSAALGVLSQAWNLEPAYSGDCESPEVDGVRCFQGDGGWVAVSTIDFPAALPLATGAGEVWVALTGLTRTEAVLSVDGDERAFSRQALSPLWPGTFLVLWRPPFENDATDAWVQAELAKTFGQEPAAAGIPLQESVRLYQELGGLAPTGQLDEALLLKLFANSAPESAPRLWREG